MANIFVTLGTQLPFDRLLDAVDSWADDRPGHDIVVQAYTKRADFKNFSVQQFLSPAMYSKEVERSDLIVGHAGMGTIITAHECGRPLVIMPRLVQYGEHRNDHQLMTVRKFKDVTGVYVASDRRELHYLLDQWQSAEACSSAPKGSRNRLVTYIAECILER